MINAKTNVEVLQLLKELIELFKPTMTIMAKQAEDLIGPGFRKCN